MPTNKISGYFHWLTLFVALCGSTAALYGADRQRGVSVGDSVGLPSTLEALVTNVPIIVSVKVTQMGPPTVREGSVYRAAILEVVDGIKGSLRVGSRIEVSLMGGTAELSGELYTSAYSIEPFQIGGELVLMLRPPRIAGGPYVIAFGQGGVYRRAANKILLPRGAERLFPTDPGAVKQTDQADFVTRLRELVRRGSGR